MKTKNELKAALDALQVRKPLRLPSAALSFTPPAAPTPVSRATPVEAATPVENPTPVDTQVPVGKTTAVQKPTQIRNPTEVEKETPVAEQAPVVKGTSVDSKTQVGKATQVESQTQVAAPTPVAIPTQVAKPTDLHVVLQSAEGESAVLTRRATEQDSSVVLEARAAEGLERGYTRLPNNVLMQLASGDFTRNEIKLALLIARFTISFQRKHAPLSKAVLARRSELREPAVLEAISGLVSKRLVEKQQGDQNRPNLLGLVLPPDWDTLTKSKRDCDATPAGSGTPVVNPPQVGNAAPVGVATPVVDETSAPVAKPTPPGVGNTTHFKDRERYLNKNSFSQLPENLRNYFDELKPARKRESEWNALRELQGDYAIEDIADCVAHLQSRGIGAGERIQPCHSPMAFLSKAMGEVLPFVEERRRKICERDEREQRKAEAERRRREADAREAAEWAVKEQAFAKAFPSEERQQEALGDLLRGLPLRPTSPAGRLLGIGKWWEKLTPYEREELTGE